MESFAIFGLLALMLAAAAPALYALRRRMAHTGELQLWQVLRRRGLTQGEVAGEGREFTNAVRRCALCPSVDECNDWLAGGRERLASFCPNAGYVERLGRP